MKKSPHILLLAAGIAALLAACVTEPREGEVTHITNVYQDTVGSVSSDSIQYREIRIDGFSHYWQTQKLQAITVDGGLVVRLDTLNDTVFAMDSLFLADSALDKTAQLPQHILMEVSGFYGPFSRILYKAAREPKVFSCHFRNRGKSIAQADSTDGSHFLRARETVIVAGEVYQDVQAWHALVEDDETEAAVRCGYIPGHGFYLGDRSSDDYGSDPYAAGGEFVIRY